MNLELRCTECRKVTTLTDNECTRIRLELVRSGVGGAHVHECACGRYQFILRLMPEKPRWTLVEANR